jgi:acyl carrier protein
MNEVAEKIYAIVADTLGLDPEEVDGKASLIDEYEAESLDFLDISFKVNKQFGIKLSRQDFLTRAQEHFGESRTLLEDGKLTTEGVAVLRARMPEAAGHPALMAGAPKAWAQRLYCADTWVRLVEDCLRHPELTGDEYLQKWLAEYAADGAAQGAGVGAAA